VNSARGDVRFLGAALAATFLWGAATLCAAEETDADEFLAALDAAVETARAGDRAAASEQLGALTERYPREPAAYYNLALTYEFDGDGNRYRGENLNLAATYYQQALALDPDFTPARFNLAVIWHKLEYAVEAEREYRLVAREGGELGRRAEINLALVLKERGRPREAAQVLTADDEAYDDVGRVRLLALLAEDAGEPGKAIRLWKRALALDDDPTLNALAVRHLQTLRGY
jgi:tetratricopeptide (TPR) repeat protein